MTVLLVILMFGLFLGLDYLRGRRMASAAVEKPAEVVSPRQPSAPPYVPEPAWVAGYQVPEDLYYHPGHTWVRVLAPDTAVVGMDDFARKLMTPAEKLTLPAVGSWLSQGASAVRIHRDKQSADLVTPLEGEVVEVNSDLRSLPRLSTDDPYGRGWLIKVRSRDLARSLRNLLSGSLVRRWMEDSRQRLELSLMSLSGSVLQDGGEPVADFTRHLSRAEWKRLVTEFLLT